ncbi:MAG: glycosyltransferase N-terminal domain-containing protein [Hyphomicrobiaceae bacterium]|nr:DUF374 domain-containing protein [Hyphomicrobiaceae bacterium]
MAPIPNKPRLLDRAVGATVAGYIRLVERTSQRPPLMHDYAADLIQHHPAIFAMWHGQFALLPTMNQFKIPTKAMLALHRDAEGLAHALARYDIELIRGAGAGVKGKDRGGANAFRNAVSALDDGYSVAMTADVPPGPARRSGHGIVTLAKISGRPIIPVAMCSSRYWSLKTWSRMTLNLPFSRLGASFGEPIWVPKDATPDELERLRQKVEENLNIATIDAYARAGVSHIRSTPPAALTASGERAVPGRKLRIYRGFTKALAPATPLLLKFRERRNKEDSTRRNERFGIASAARPIGTVIWFHAASVGETNAVIPLIEELRQLRPRTHVLLTTGTVTSARVATTRLNGIAIHQYVPYDAPKFVERFLNHWQPNLAIFVESEIWPNLILSATSKNIPLVLVNGRMSKGSFRNWRQNVDVARPIFSRFAAIMAQDRAFAERFVALGGANVTVSGNLKTDSPPLPVNAAARTKLELRLGDRPLLLAASTHDDEEDILAAAHTQLRATHPRLITIIAPRHPERATAIIERLQGQGYDVRQRSRDQEPDTSGTKSTDGIYLADTLNELGTLFAIAQVAFIGKSLSREPGGHNPIEAVRHGAVVLTGPGWSNFTESFTALLKAGGALEVRNADEIATAAAHLFDDGSERARMRKSAEGALENLTGALAKTRAVILTHLAPETTPAPVRELTGVS